MNKNIVLLLLITPFFNYQTIYTKAKAIVVGSIQNGSSNVPGAPTSSQSSNPPITPPTPSTNQTNANNQTTSGSSIGLLLPIDFAPVNSDTSTSSNTNSSTTNGSTKKDTSKKTTTKNKSTSTPSTPPANTVTPPPAKNSSKGSSTKAPAAQSAQFTGTFYNNTKAPLYSSYDMATFSTIAPNASITLQCTVGDPNTSTLNIMQNTSSGPWTQITGDGAVVNLDGSGNPITSKKTSSLTSNTNISISLDSAKPANLVFSTTPPAPEKTSTSQKTPSTSSTPPANTATPPPAKNSAKGSTTKNAKAQPVQFTGNFYNSTGGSLYITNDMQNFSTLAKGDHISLNCIQNDQSFSTIMAAQSQSSPWTQITVNDAKSIALVNFDASGNQLNANPIILPITNNAANLYITLDSAKPANLVFSTTPPTSEKTNTSQKKPSTSSTPPANTVTPPPAKNSSKGSTAKAPAAQPVQFTGNFYNTTSAPLYITNGTDTAQITPAPKKQASIKGQFYTISGNPISINCQQDTSTIQIVTSTSNSSPVTQITYLSSAPDSIQISNFDGSGNPLTQTTIPVTQETNNLYLSLDSANPANIIVGTTPPSTTPTKTAPKAATKKPTSSNNAQTETSSAQAKAAAEAQAAQKAAAAQAKAQTATQEAQAQAATAQAAAQAQATAQAAAAKMSQTTTFAQPVPSNPVNAFIYNHADSVYVTDSAGSPANTFALSNNAVHGVGGSNAVYIYKNSSAFGPCLELTAPANGIISIVECNANKKAQSQAYTLTYNYGTNQYAGQTQAPNIHIQNNPDPSSVSGLIISLGQ